METGVMIKTFIAFTAVVAAIWGGIETLDNRHVLKQVYETEQAMSQETLESLLRTQLKREIRELRELIAHEGDPTHIARLEAELQDLIDTLCVKFPEDRECKS